jgi:replication fork clamp-binding protein CrfC
MTTLPTLIRNKHGQVEPLLRLNEIKPLVELTENIFKKLEQIDKSKEGLTETNPVMNGTKDGKELIQMLMKNKCYDFKSSYQGQESIFTFLRHLNDVMRLAKELGLSVEKVYSSYQESKDLPVIEVEFCHLQAMGKTANGNLSILDTPGPNEFGQSEALKTVFLHQLKRATAVMLVIDYTQMKSEAEAAVREQIESIREQLDKNRLSVLVNKFDQANATSMQKEEVQEYVASTLMNDSTTFKELIYLCFQRVIIFCNIFLKLLLKNSRSAINFIL